MRYGWLAVCCALGLTQHVAAHEWNVGLSRVDVTPTEPIRLSGYGNRATPFDDVDTPLYVRAMALQGSEPMSEPQVLIAVDTIGFPAALTKRVALKLEERHNLSRSQVAFCGTHSHTAPHLPEGLTNLLATPLTSEEKQAADRYSAIMEERILSAVAQALADLKPARLFYGTGEATFARNRRVIKEGVWTGFGINPDGPVDHSLPMLKITDASGKNIRGYVFNYACHCTTFGGNYNNVNGDWAGYAAAYVEADTPGTVALCTIGCGADANPERDSARALMIAQAQGREIAEEIARLSKATDLNELTAPVQTSFGYAGLPIDRPTLNTLKERLRSASPQERRHAENMLATQERMGRLPETYPMPIQVWRFGDAFAMVFLGGEVCVEYAQRIQRELPHPVWVSAYANDVFGYVAPERMRAEGGYEVDRSMIYYNQPGRWSAGTEDVVLKRFHELYNNQTLDRPQPVEKALETFTLPKGYVIEAIAAEPLIRDPVNFSLGPDGRLWVVEMGDYPRGGDIAAGNDLWKDRETPWEGPPGGRVKILTDTDHDGRYDEATLFLENLSFPTGVFPWKDGAFICCAPDILFAHDPNGDGVADSTEVLYTGFVESNPQHRVNGFEYGLDGWLYLASGASSRDIEIVGRGESVNISGRDLRIHPLQGDLEPVSGRSQYGRCRDQWGNWYGNTNSEPLFQFVIEDRDLKRNPFVPSPSVRHFLTSPRVAPPVYPTSRTVDRFNDLHAADRFTSACSPHVYRDVHVNDGSEMAFICEPVHNLISRVQLSGNGIQREAARFPSEESSEFCSSSDGWFRPVRMLTAPDGSVWVCDMYRHVIEHPQWIPEAWQGQLNLYAGANRGRIYRIHPQSLPTESAPNFLTMSDAELIEQIASSNGWRRDTAQRLLIDRQHNLGEASITRLKELATRHASPPVRIQALWTLATIRPDDVPLAAVLGDTDSRVIVNGLRIAAITKRLDTLPDLLPLVVHESEQVKFELALAAATLPADTRASLLSDLAVIGIDNPWMRTAILSSAADVAASVLVNVLERLPESEERGALIQQLIATELGPDPEAGLVNVLDAVTPTDAREIHSWHMEALSTCLAALRTRHLSLNVLEKSDAKSAKQVLTRAQAIVAEARRSLATDEIEETRRAAARLVGLVPAPRAAHVELLQGLLSPQEPPELQRIAIEGLVDLGAAETLIARFRSLAPSARQTVFARMLPRKEGATTLLTALEQGRLSSSDLDAATREALLQLKDPAIRTRAEAVLSTGTEGARADIVSRYLQEVNETGDPQAGRELFTRRCATCHQLGGVGKNFGPQLTALQKKPLEVLLTAILDPNRAVEAKYGSYALSLRDGRVFTGLIAAESATSITLQQADGTSRELLRVDVEEMVGTGRSFMPEGLEKDLTPAELADVIAFIRQAKAE